MKTVCCVCKRTKSQNGWVEKAIVHMSDMSHGYCPECYLRMMRKFRKRSFLKNESSTRLLNLR